MKINRLIKILSSNKVVCNLRNLYPEYELNKRINLYYKKKVKNCLFILSAGMILAVAVTYGSEEGSIENGRLIRRNGYGEGDRKVQLLVSETQKEDDKRLSENEFQKEVTISEKRYSDEELRCLSNEFKKLLLDEIKGENSSLEHIEKSLKNVQHIEGYPFDVTYRTDKPLILSRTLALNEEKLSEELRRASDDGLEANQAIEIQIIANIAYFEYEEEFIFYVCAYERELTDTEAFEKELESHLSPESDEYKETDYYVLPKKINGKNVEFSEARSSDGGLIIFFVLVVTVATFFLQDRELEKEVSNRNKELIYEYPALVNRFALFINAGMPVKNVWMKICSDYLKEVETTGNKNYLYEEMLITRKQMLDGMRDIDSFEDFAKRINIPKYRFFISLLVQAVTIGRSDISLALKTESQDAYLERKNNAKRQFEEAGTKLLAPMFMMLLVVIIILMFPAFTSFRI